MASVIAVPTQSGSTARLVSQFRPRRPVVAASPEPEVLQQLALDWAVVPIVIDAADTLEDLWRRTVDASVASGLVDAGERVVLTGGTGLTSPARPTTSWCTGRLTAGRSSGGGVEARRRGRHRSSRTVVPRRARSAGWRRWSC